MKPTGVPTRAWRVAIAALLVLCLAEAAARLSGITDFAIYAVDDGIGYIARPNQSGRFLDRNSWVFNDRSMATAERWDPAMHPNLLLIGNSVVMGGNPYDQKDKLASVLAGLLGTKYSVWPIATGGWSNVNEMVYLRRNPDIVQKANFFVWEYMAGGLTSLSQWRGDYVFPSRHPWCATCYVIRRYVIPRYFKVQTNELPPTGPLIQSNLAAFERAIVVLSQADGRARPGIIFLYPDKRELHAARSTGQWLPERAAIEALATRTHLEVVDVASDSRWNESLYRDGTHPTVEGNRVLAAIIAAAIPAPASAEQ